MGNNGTEKGEVFPVFACLKNSAEVQLLEPWKNIRGATHCVQMRPGLKGYMFTFLSLFVALLRTLQAATGCHVWSRV